MSYRIASLALAAALGLSPAAALAGSDTPITVRAADQPAPPDTIRTVVKYGDLELTSLDGVQALKHRVRVAARGACRDVYSHEALSFDYQAACTKNSIADARPQVDRAVEMAEAGKRAGTEIALDIRR